MSHSPQRFVTWVLGVGMLVLAVPAAHALPPGFTNSTVAAVPPKASDVGSIDAIVAAAYDSISGPAGQRRDWNRMRSLFTANARLMAQEPDGLGNGSVEDYITKIGPFLEKNGFFERETGRVVEQYGDIAHLFSSYEARAKPNGPVVTSGVNSFQLVHHDNRWWIVSILWQAATKDNPVPQRYLKRGR